MFRSFRSYLVDVVVCSCLLSQEKERRQLLRNRRLADALGIRAALGAGAAIGGAKVMFVFLFL